MYQDTSSPGVSVQSSRSDAGYPPVATEVLSACDNCHAKKVKCDRQDPCRNCQDTKSDCLRDRPKARSKPQKSFSAKIIDSIDEMKLRMDSLEGSFTRFAGKGLGSGKARESLQEMGGPSKRTGSQAKVVVVASPARKRTNVAAFGQNGKQPLPTVVPSQSIDQTKTSADDSFATALFSATEAQHLISQEFARGTRLSNSKRTAFESAISSLNNSLNTLPHGDEHLGSGQDVSDESLEELSIPSIDVIQLMLKESVNPNRIDAITNSLPVLSRRSIAQIASGLRDLQTRKTDAAGIICLCSCAAHFIQGGMFSGQTTGIEDHVREQIASYFHSARVGIERLSLFALPSLKNLQALLYGAINAVEFGDPARSWDLTAIAIKMCIALKLHKRVNSFTSGPPEILLEAQACLVLLYINDKGLALNLGHPPCLPDSYVEIDMQEVRFWTPPVQQIISLFLELAKVQGAVVEFQAAKARLSTAPTERARVFDGIMRGMDRLWGLMQAAFATIERKTSDAEYEIIMAEFAFHAVKTAFLHSAVEGGHTEASVAAARSAMGEMKKLYELVENAGWTKDKLQSRAHWTIIHYPFTPFFVLFCNIVSTSNHDDFLLMENFLQHLTLMRDCNSMFFKLHRLCRTFVALASSIFTADDEPSCEKSRRIGTNQASAVESASVAQQGISNSNFNPPLGNTSSGAQGQFIPRSQNDYPTTATGYETLPGRFDSTHTDDAGNFQNALFLHPQEELDGYGMYTLPNNNDNEEFLFAQLIDAQPRLQWLDADFPFEADWDALYSG